MVVDLLTVFIAAVAIVSFISAVLTFRVGRDVRRMGEKDTGMSPSLVRHPILLNPALWAYLTFVVVLVVVSLYFLGVYT